jgi:hypothetical protein
VAAWPRCDEASIDQKVERDMEILQDLVVKVGTCGRRPTSIPPGRIEVLVHAESAAERAPGGRAGSAAARPLPGLRGAQRGGLSPGLVAARGVVRGLEIALPWKDSWTSRPSARG